MLSQSYDLIVGPIVVPLLSLDHHEGTILRFWLCVPRNGKIKVLNFKNVNIKTLLLHYHP